MKKLIFSLLFVLFIIDLSVGQTMATKNVSKISNGVVTVEKVNLTYEELTSKLERTNLVYDGNFEVWKSKTGVMYAIKRTEQGVLKKRLPKVASSI